MFLDSDFGNRSLLIKIELRFKCPLLYEIYLYFPNYRSVLEETLLFLPGISYFGRKLVD